MVSEIQKQGESWKVGDPAEKGTLKVGRPQQILPKRVVNKSRIRGSSRSSMEKKRKHRCSEKGEEGLRARGNSLVDPGWRRAGTERGGLRKRKK